MNPVTYNESANGAYPVTMPLEDMRWISSAFTGMQNR